MTGKNRFVTARAETKPSQKLPGLLASAVPARSLAAMTFCYLLVELLVDLSGSDTNGTSACTLIGRLSWQFRWSPRKRVSIYIYLETPEAEISAAGTWGRLKSPQLKKSRLNQKTMNTIKTNYIPSNQAQNACS